MTDTLARIEQHLAAAAAAIQGELAAITDPAARQDVARETLETLLPKLGHDVKMARAAAVAELKQGRTLAQVGQLLGGLSIARVDQILKAGGITAKTK
ncbi:hypothetical protein [Streptomyces resistomycificus]|uniref:Uncharacterized protein n=1 Tax=Streptomyces resistomycificus TaxID=67356 RepID=A0A0L8L4X4_9ACTN|nr:hypothetical protein [Streptomyces resistomycificus]KOG33273.1 hypothetical protein ADK37_23050 [Streptomyces resistomycificus]KUN99468.1 hypothetical protein AQJ84_11000 [Streptomyces resistomycificus]